MSPFNESLNIVVRGSCHLDGSVCTLIWNIKNLRAAANGSPIYIRDHVSPAPVLLEELLHLLLQVGRDVAAPRVVILRRVFIQGVLGDLWTAVMRTTTTMIIIIMIPCSMLTPA